MTIMVQRLISAGLTLLVAILLVVEVRMQFDAGEGLLAMVSR